MDRDIIRTLALKTGFGMKYISKENKISQILDRLSNIFSNEVVLKGGTAINRVYLQKKGINRFSEDIDLDYISDKSLDERINKIKSLMKKIDGFDIGEARLMHRTLRFNCSYVNEFDQKDLVRIEFYLSQKKLICVYDPKKEILNSSFLGGTSTAFRVYSLEDLIARKIVALHQRFEGKDIYDIYYSLDLEFEISKFIIALNLVLDFYKIKMDLNKFFDSLLKKTKDAYKNSKFIGNTTNHFIPKKLRPNWGIFINTLEDKLIKLKEKLCNY